MEETWQQKLHKALRIAYGKQFDPERLHDAITKFVGLAFLDRVHAEHEFKKVWPELKNAFK